MCWIIRKYEMEEVEYVKCGLDYGKRWFKLKNGKVIEKNYDEILWSLKKNPKNIHDFRKMG